MSTERKKLILALALIFAVNIFIIALAQRASADLYKKGSGGAVVTEIQTRLKNWGYYFGAVDGVYGSQTEKAVRWFQEKNGLTADGQVGDQTLAALGMPSGGGTSSGGKTGSSGGSGSLDLLARLISAEARGEPYEGQVAVGAVVLNRTRHPSFPNTVAEVIYQPGAFSCLDDGQFDEPVAGHSDQQMDLVAAAHRQHRQAPILFIKRQQNVELLIISRYNRETIRTQKGDGL